MMRNMINILIIGLILEVIFLVALLALVITFVIELKLAEGIHEPAMVHGFVRSTLFTLTAM